VTPPWAATGDATRREAVKIRDNVLPYMIPVNERLDII
jgi:hypothetical protein